MPLCPTCHKPLAPSSPSPTTEKFYPFCSRRCADVDLHRWLSEAYTVPASEEQNPSDD